MTGRWYNTIRKREGKPNKPERTEKMRNANEIRQDIERVEKAIFLESMADFMNWNKYHELNAELRKLKKELEEIEGE